MELRVLFYNYCHFCYTKRHNLIKKLSLVLRDAPKMVYMEETKLKYTVRKLRHIKELMTPPPLPKLEPKEKPKGIYHSRTPKVVLDWSTNDSKT